VVDALIKAGKTFDFLFLPGAGHTEGGQYGERRRWDFFVEHLIGVEPPDRNAPRPPLTPAPSTPAPPDPGEAALTSSTN
jgi:hypothetical protein